MLPAMPWNIFKTRQSSTGSASPVFQNTVVEDRTRSQFDLLHAQQAGQPEPGDLPAAMGVIGRYQLRTVLGEGGLGTVYGAWDPLLSRRVAVKTLQLRWHQQPGALGAPDELILNEARAAARLSHPHIVTVYDAGSSDQGVYVAMEPLQGLDLRQMLRQGWRPTPMEAAGLVRRVAEALAYAHGKGVIHCDIKPANIFMVDKRQPKVLDFGIARVARRDGSTTVTPSAGSPHYLSPEQLRHTKVDRRCDVYSLGVVLYELLTGRPPYTGQSMEEISHAVLNSTQPQARMVDPDVPAGLSAIAARAMARSPEARYPSARHLAAALREWRSSDEAQGLSNPESKGRRMLPLLSLVLVAGLAAGAAWWWFNKGPGLHGLLGGVPVITPAVPASAPASATAAALPASAPAEAASDAASAAGMVAGVAASEPASASAATVGASAP